MKILFYQPHSNHDTSDNDAWLHGLQQALPQAALREWQPGDHAGADYAVVWRPPRELFAGRHDLRAIFNLGAGVDAILGLEREFPGTLPREALLVRLEDTGMGQQMVEYIAYAVLRYLRRFDEYEQLQQARRWKVLEPHPRATFTVGVMGLGVLGTQVAQALAALGLPVRGFSRNAKRIEGVACASGELHGAAFDAFLDGVKVLVNLLPHTSDTADVLNARTFSKLARGAYLVNVARGGHLVERDLIDALAHGQIAAATLDVFREEPLPADHPFWSEPRITITPHSAAQTLRDESIEQVAHKIASLARGEPISGIVERERGY